MALNLKHLTVAQLLQRLRDRYRDARGSETGRLAAWLLDRIAAGDITDAQVRTAFGMTTTQYNNLKTRLTSRANEWRAVSGASGE